MGVPTRVSLGGTVNQPLPLAVKTTHWGMSAPRGEVWYSFCTFRPSIVQKIPCPKKSPKIITSLFAGHWGMSAPRGEVWYSLYTLRSPIVKKHLMPFNCSYRIKSEPTATYPSLEGKKKKSGH